MSNLQENQNNADLMPCPFCGSTKTEVHTYGEHDFLGSSGYVQCHNCSTTGPEVSAEDQAAAIAAWNRRAPERWMREMLSDCAATFRHYERLHLGKMPPDTEKATSNANKAARIERALTQNAEVTGNAQR